MEQVVFKDEPLFHYIFWKWTAAEASDPAFPGDASAHLPPHIWISNDVVQYISIPTRIPYAQVWTLLGEPNAGEFTMSGYRGLVTYPGRRNAYHAAAYADGQLVFSTQAFCPVNPDVFWGATVTVSLYSSDSVSRLNTQKYTLKDWFYSPPCRLP